MPKQKRSWLSNGLKWLKIPFATKMAIPFVLPLLFSALIEALMMRWPAESIVAKPDSLWTEDSRVQYLYLEIEALRDVCGICVSVGFDNSEVTINQIRLESSNRNVDSAIWDSSNCGYRYTLPLEDTLRAGERLTLQFVSKDRTNRMRPLDMHDCAVRAGLGETKAQTGSLRNFYYRFFWYANDPQVRFVFLIGLAIIAYVWHNWWRALISHGANRENSDQVESSSTPTNIEGSGGG